MKSFYGVLTGGHPFLPYDGYVWRIPAPRVVAFCWIVRLHKPLTSDMSQRQNHTVVNGCLLCLHDAEDVHHLFIHSYTTQVWNVIFRRFGIAWAMP